MGRVLQGNSSGLSSLPRKEFFAISLVSVVELEVCGVGSGV